MKKSRIIQGLMRVDRLSDEQLYDLIRYDLDHGIYFFDLADIYVGGEAEAKLGRILKAHPGLREEMFIQSKVSIRRGETGGYYDLSYEHIRQGLDDILARLGIDHLDSLLLHRPDIFMDAEEVAKAFDEIEKEGKVKHFGVSNFPRSMIEYLTSKVKQPIEYNQVQLGVGHLAMVEEVFNFNVDSKEAISLSDDTYFFLKKNGIKIQAWSPFLVRFFEGSLFDEDKYPEANRALAALAEKYRTSKCAIATAFLLRLDKDLTVITGSMNPAHVQECLDGEELDLSKEDWYYLYKASGHMLP